MKLKLIAAILFSIFMMSSCSYSTVEKSNQKLMSSMSDNIKFNNELARELSVNPNSFTYQFGRYFIKDGREYVDINIKRESFKTTIAVLINNWAKIEGIKRTKGMGYSGAGLKGLKLSLATTGFVYQGLDEIVD
ncbi:MAG: hypothetical protein V4592_12660 [Bacteroidota bacterium]